MARKGFTLVELMITIVVVGLLAAVAIPRFTGLVARARCTEAVVVLHSYEKLQDAFHGLHGRAGTLEEIGLEFPANGWFNYEAFIEEEEEHGSLFSGGLGVAAPGGGNNGGGNNGGGNNGGGVDKVAVCHIPPGNPDNGHIINIGHPAYAAHIAHGDSPAPCPESGNISENVTLMATVRTNIGKGCIVGNGVMSNWTPYGSTRGDFNSGSCSSYMGSTFKR